MNSRNGIVSFVRSWINTIGLTIGLSMLEYGFFSGTHFVTHVLLARWLPAEQYGAFASAYAVFLLFAAVHTAILTQPMLILGPGKYAGHWSRYLRILLSGQIRFGASVCVGLLLLAALFWHREAVVYAWTLAGLALAAPWILLLWLGRRACYVHLAPHLAAVSGASYMGLVLGGLYALHQLDALSALSTLGVMGSASLLSSVSLFRHLYRPRPEETDGPTAWTVRHDHSHYGAWSIASAVTMWVSHTLYWVLLPAWVGLDETGLFQSVTNAIMPMLHVMAALSVVFLPMVSRWVHEQGLSGTRRFVRTALPCLWVGSGAYAVLLLVYGDPVLQWVYEGRYGSHTGLLSLVSLLPFSYAAVSVFSTALQAMDCMDRIFYAYLLSSVVTLTGGLALTAVWGVAGAITGWGVASVITASALAFFYRTQQARVTGGV